MTDTRQTGHQLDRGGNTLTRCKHQNDRWSSDFYKTSLKVHQCKISNKCDKSILESKEIEKHVTMCDTLIQQQIFVICNYMLFYS